MHYFIEGVSDNIMLMRLFIGYVQVATCTQVRVLMDSANVVLQCLVTLESR